LRLYKSLPAYSGILFYTEHKEFQQKKIRRRNEKKDVMERKRNLFRPFTVHLRMTSLLTVFAGDYSARGRTSIIVLRMMKDGALMTSMHHSWYGSCAYRDSAAWQAELSRQQRTHAACLAGRTSTTCNQTERTTLRTFARRPAADTWNIIRGIFP